VSDETITDEEFERLLDELHGPAAAPAGGAAPAAAGEAGGGDRGQLVTLAADLRIGAVQELAERLRGCLDGVGTVALDGSAVEQLDTAGVQLLAVFARQLREQDTPLAWQGASAALRDGAALLGLGEVLGLDGGQGSDDARCGAPR